MNLYKIVESCTEEVISNVQSLISVYPDDSEMAVVDKFLILTGKLNDIILKYTMSMSKKDVLKIAADDPHLAVKFGMVITHKIGNCQLNAIDFILDNIYEYLVKESKDAIDLFIYGSAECEPY